jgi:hypothetical protein
LVGTGFADEAFLGAIGEGWNKSGKWKLEIVESRESRDDGRGEPLRGCSWFFVRGSLFVVLCSWFFVRGSLFVVGGRETRGKEKRKVESGKAKRVKRPKF